MIVDFDASGFPEAEMTGDPVGEVSIVGDGAEVAVVKWSGMRPLPGKKWRLSFVIEPKDEKAGLGDLPPLELKAALKSGEIYLTESWIYRIKP